jgi:hypothetical protein
MDGRIIFGYKEVSDMASFPAPWLLLWPLLSRVKNEIFHFLIYWLLLLNQTFFIFNLLGRTMANLWGFCFVVYSDIIDIVTQSFYKNY